MTEQEKEIQTITERNITLKLSDADCIRISEKAATNNITVAQLLENFIGDLVSGTYSNGSNERMYANQWFNRCWFSMSPGQTFLKYLIEFEDVENFIENLNDIESYKQDIEKFECQLKNGYMIGWNGSRYAWSELIDSNGNHLYSNKEKWEAAVHENIETAKEHISFCEKTISDSWNRYLRMAKEPQQYEKAISEILTYNKHLNVFMEGK